MDMTSPALPVRLISTRARQVLLSLADLQASTWWMEQGPACTHMRCTTSRLTCSRPLCGLVLDSLLAQQLSCTSQCFVLGTSHNRGSIHSLQASAWQGAGQSGAERKLTPPGDRDHKSSQQCVALTRWIEF